MSEAPGRPQPGRRQLAVIFLGIFVGGALGSLLRELMTPLLPIGGPVTSTLWVNTLACLVLGWLYAIRHRVHAHLLLLGAVGFCGGLSTFSSLVAEIWRLYEVKELLNAALAPALEIALGLIAALIGERLGRGSKGPAP